MLTGFKFPMEVYRSYRNFKNEHYEICLLMQKYAKTALKSFLGM